MFTGIITDIGVVTGREGDSFTIKTHYPSESLTVGASLCCDGVCLTLTNIEAANGDAHVSVDVSNETRSKTTLGNWEKGRRVNLERAIQAGEEMGGHVVSGHVDGLAEVRDIIKDGESRRFVFEAPEHLAMYIAPKGSVALDGASLTVNEVSGTRFGVNIIPHTLTATTWGEKAQGDHVNIEVDLFARYVARLLEYRQ